MIATMVFTGDEGAITVSEPDASLDGVRIAFGARGPRVALTMEELHVLVNAGADILHKFFTETDQHGRVGRVLPNGSLYLGDE